MVGSVSLAGYSKIFLIENLKDFFVSLCFKFGNRMSDLMDARMFGLLMSATRKFKGEIFAI